MRNNVELKCSQKYNLSFIAQSVNVYIFCLLQYCRHVYNTFVNFPFIDTNHFTDNNAKDEDLSLLSKVSRSALLAPSRFLNILNKHHFLHLKKSLHIIFQDQSLFLYYFFLSQNFLCEFFFNKATKNHQCPCHEEGVEILFVD